jgi:hypothetical protein
MIKKRMGKAAKKIKKLEKFYPSILLFFLKDYGNKLIFIENYT